MKTLIIVVAALNLSFAAFAFATDTETEIYFENCVGNRELANYYADQADLKTMGAKQVLSQILGMGPRPDDPADAIQWEQQIAKLQNHLDRLSAENSKLTALTLKEGLGTLGLCVRH